MTCAQKTRCHLFGRFTWEPICSCIIIAIIILYIIYMSDYMTIYVTWSDIPVVSKYLKNNIDK